MNIEYLNNTNKAFDFDEYDLIQDLVKATLDEVGYHGEVGVCVSLVGEEEIHNLNLEYRGIDKPTDVLSFPLNEFDKPAGFDDEIFISSMATDPDTDELQLGDVVLCYEKVVSQAHEYGHSELREFAFLVVHSLLHLLGYDHEEDDEREVMEQMQKKILEKNPNWR